MKKFRSCAEWPDAPPSRPTSVSTDDHDTESQALAVCGMLERDGLGGEGRVFPLRTWVEPIKEACARRQQTQAALSKKTARRA